MSSYFQNQLRSFQGEISSAGSKIANKRSIAPPTATASTSRPSPAPSLASSTTSTTKATTDAAAKRKRPEVPANVVYSQPADTGSGKHIMTQVVYATDYLKTKDKPISFRDIIDYLSIPDLDDQGRRLLEDILQRHPKVEYDPGPTTSTNKTGTGTYRFRPTHNVRSRDDLLAFLQRQPTAQGINVKDLRDGWPNCLPTIAALETDGLLLVTRHKKDGTPRMLWPDDPSLRHPVDAEFHDLWHKVKAPVEPGELRKELVEFGLTPTSVVNVDAGKGRMREKKKRASKRGGKTTNTHMAAILKDYSHTRPVKG